MFGDFWQKQLKKEIFFFFKYTTFWVQKKVKIPKKMCSIFFARWFFSPLYMYSRHDSVIAQGLIPPRHDGHKNSQKSKRKKNTQKLRFFSTQEKNVYPTKKGGLEGGNRIFGQFPNFCKKHQKYQFLKNWFFRPKLF